MSGTSSAHNEIELNIAANLRARVRDRGCRLFLANMRIKVPSAPPYRYGDLSALCGKAEFTKIGGVDVLLNPSLIIEVLSPSTEKYDQNQKYKQYQSIESFREYLLVRQDGAFVTRLVKQDGGGWMHHTYDDPAQSVQLESLGCELTLDEIYRNVTFPETEEIDELNIR